MVIWTVKSTAGLVGSVKELERAVHDASAAIREPCLKWNWRAAKEVRPFGKPLSMKCREWVPGHLSHIQPFREMCLREGTRKAWGIFEKKHRGT